MKYYVRTVEDCTPTLYEFKTKKAMDSFLREFGQKVTNSNGDFWVDFVFKGEILFKDELETIKNKSLK